LKQLAELRKDVNALEGVTKAKKMEMEAKAKEVEDMFMKGQVVAYKIGNEILTLENRIGKSVAYKQVLDELRPLLTKELQEKTDALVKEYTKRTYSSPVEIFDVPETEKLLIIKNSKRVSPEEYEKYLDKIFNTTKEWYEGVEKLMVRFKEILKEVKDKGELSEEEYTKSVERLEQGGE